MVLALGRRCARPCPTDVDRRLRSRVLRHRSALLTALLAPLDPLGYPGGYIPLAFVLARALKQRGVHGHADLVLAALFAWTGHRLVKLEYKRQRPPRGVRVKGPKLDSFPSGHTTGATACSVVLARLLRDGGILTPREAALFAVGVSGVMGVSRVTADVHWATDVLGGWLLGASVAQMLLARRDLVR